jgi:hypothetical protein
VFVNVQKQKEVQRSCLDFVNHKKCMLVVMKLTGRVVENSMKFIAFFVLLAN